MADSAVQRKIEKYIRDIWLPEKYQQSFKEEELRLLPGGRFKYNAVSADGRIVASISTSKATTAGGSEASGKLHKLRSDMLFLIMTPAFKRLIVLTEKDMYERCLREAANGRVLNEIEFMHAELPTGLKKNWPKPKKPPRLRSR